MLWLVPAWMITVAGAYFLGYYLHRMKQRIEILEETVKMKIDKKPVVKEPESSLLDPLDEIEEAKWQHAQLMKKLNPDE